MLLVHVMKQCDCSQIMIFRISKDWVILALLHTVGQGCLDRNAFSWHVHSKVGLNPMTSGRCVCDGRTGARDSIRSSTCPASTSWRAYRGVLNWGGMLRIPCYQLTYVARCQNRETWKHYTCGNCTSLTQQNGRRL